MRMASPRLLFSLTVYYFFVCLFCIFVIFVFARLTICMSVCTIITLCCPTFSLPPNGHLNINGITLLNSMRIMSYSFSFLCLSQDGDIVWFASNNWWHKSEQIDSMPVWASTLPLPMFSPFPGNLFCDNIYLSYIDGAQLAVHLSNECVLCTMYNRTMYDICLNCHLTWVKYDLSVVGLIYRYIYTISTHWHTSNVIATFYSLFCCRIFSFMSAYLVY